MYLHLLVILGVVGVHFHVVDGAWLCPWSCGSLKAPGTFTYPENGNYANNENCTWTVTAPEGQRLRAVFTKLELQGQDSDCEHDYIEVLTRGGDVLAKVCEEPVSPVSVLDNTMKLRFVSDSSGSGQGFSVNLDPTMDAGTVTTCGGQLLPGDSLRFPEGRKAESEKTDCMWIVTAPEGKVVEVRFKNFRTNAPEVSVKERCKRNYLKIWPLAPSESYAGTYCGSYPSLSPLARLISSSRTMKVKFHAEGEYGELSAEFSAIDPQSVIVQSFVSQFFKEAQPNDVDAVWVADLKAGVQLELPYGTTGQIVWQPEKAESIYVDVTIRYQYRGGEKKMTAVGGSANQSWVIQFDGVYRQDGSADLERTKSTQPDVSWKCQPSQFVLC